MARKKYGKLGWVLSFSALLSAFLLFAATPAMVLYRWYDGLDWVRVQCIVLNSSASLTVDRNPIHGRKDQVNLSIQYQYDFEGNRYIGTKFYLTTPSRVDRTLVEGSGLYPRGKLDYCFVDPSDPAQSVFRRDFPFFHLYILLLLGLTGGVCSYLFWKSVNTRK